LKHVHGELLAGEENAVAAEKWTASLVDLAYAGELKRMGQSDGMPNGIVLGLKSRRRLRVLLNPIGGKVIYDSLDVTTCKGI